MTIHHILKEVRRHKRGLSERQLRRYMTLADVKPVGIRQRPQRYPANAANRILQHLQLIPAGRAAK